MAERFKRFRVRAVRCRASRRCLTLEKADSTLRARARAFPALFLPLNLARRARLIATQLAACTRTGTAYRASARRALSARLPVHTRVRCLLALRDAPGSFAQRF